MVEVKEINRQMLCLVTKRLEPLLDQWVGERIAGNQCSPVNRFQIETVAPKFYLWAS